MVTEWTATNSMHTSIVSSTLTFRHSAAAVLLRSGLTHSILTSNRNSRMSAASGSSSVCSTISTSSFSSSSSTTTTTTSSLHPHLLTLGTFKLRGDACRTVVRSALQQGVRRIDTAVVYKNEEEIGQVVEEWRKENREKETANEKQDSAATTTASSTPLPSLCGIHLTSKLTPAQMTSPSSAYTAVVESLSRLRLSCIDSYLIHWPGRSGLKPNDAQHAKARQDTYEGLEKAYDEGLIKSIGLSNFEIKHLIELQQHWRIKPTSNQFELHPAIYQTQKELIEWCRKNGMRIQAYSPLGAAGGPLLQHELIQRLSKQLNKPPSQILLKWSLQHGFDVIVKTNSVERLRENLEATSDSWCLSQEQMTELDEMETKYGMQRFAWNPQTVS